MASNVYSLQMPHKIIAGFKSIEQLPLIAEEFEVKRVTIITDKGIFKLGLTDRPKEILEKAGVCVNIINWVNAEPEMSHVLDLYEAVKDIDSQMFIAIGGGSAMDVTKILAALMTNSEFAEDILDGSKVVTRGIPTVMIPTTAGTGSEATPNAIVVVPEQELKIGVISNHFIPDCVILDPELTVKLPPAITASTGMDAFCHAIECFISKASNPLCDVFALRAIKLITENLRKACSDGSDLEARQNMMLGALLGGICISTSSTTAVHALSYPLGGKYRIAHGISNAILLTYVMEFTLDSVVDKFQDVAAAMGIKADGKSKEQVARAVIDEMYSLISDVQISCDLTKYGITEDDLDGMADAALKVTRLLNNHPKLITKKDAIDIYKRLL